MKIITNEQIEAIGIPPRQCVEWVRNSFMMKKDSKLKAKLSLCPQGIDFFNTMPCILPDKYHCFSVKVVSRIEGETPALKSKIALFDTLTGEMTVLMDADWITSWRTGAVAALAAQTFRKRDASVYALMGLGEIGHHVMKCIPAIIPADQTIEMKLLRYKDYAERFINEFSYMKNVKFSISDNIDDFIEGSDVIFSCITYAKDILEPNLDMFKSGCTVIPIHTRGFQNCDLVFDQVFGDDTDHINGFKHFNQFKMFHEFADVLDGTVTGRKNDEEKILSYNIGIGLHDAIFAFRINEFIK